MDLSGVDLIEELHHDEGVKNDGVVLRWRGMQRSVPAAVNIKDLLTWIMRTTQDHTELFILSNSICPLKQYWRLIRWLTHKQQSEDDYELVDAVAQDVLSHGTGDQRFVSTVGFSHQQRFSWRFGGQSQRCKSVHDQVDPQHLDCFKRRILKQHIRHFHWQDFIALHHTSQTRPVKCAAFECQWSDVFFPTKRLTVILW